MAESFAGITVPDGEPEELLSAGVTLSGVSGGLEGVGAQLRGMPETLASWRGPASISYGNSCLSNGTALSAAEQALSQCAVLAQRYARDLGEAQDDARAAIEDAREAQRRIDRAQAQLTDAREAGAAAALRGADASAEVLMSGLTGSPNAGAMADLDAARTDADAAAKREGAAQRELEGAEEDLRAAQKRGERAERAAEDAARAAAGGFEGLASASPAAVYAGQVAQPREAARREGDDEDGPLDDAWNWAGGAAEDVGNTVSGFTNELSFGVVDLGGDKDSGAYKTGQVGSYVPWNPVSALKSLGTGAFKLGVKKLGKEAVEEGTEAAVRRNLDEAAKANVGLASRGRRPAPGTRVRPPGIPAGWRIRGTRSGGGTRYYDPSNPGNSVRVMQGSPTSPHPNSQVPYVRWQRNGKPLDINGHELPSANVPEAHIPLEKFRLPPGAFER